MAKFFVNRPIVAIVISIFFVIVGIVAILGLPIAQYPDIVPPEIYINTTYVGADAQTRAALVARWEREHGGHEGRLTLYRACGCDQCGGQASPQRSTPHRNRSREGACGRTRRYPS